MIDMTRRCKKIGHVVMRSGRFSVFDFDQNRRNDLQTTVRVFPRAPAQRVGMSERMYHTQLSVSALSKCGGVCGGMCGEPYSYAAASIFVKNV